MKRIIIGAILAAMLLPTATQPVEATTYPKGDLNCSGAVTSLDISLEIHMVAGGTNPFECGQSADLNCSGTLTSTDISIMMFIAAGGNYTPPGSCA